MTDAFKRRRRRPFGSLEAAKSRMSSAHLDQAIAIWWLTATICTCRAQNPACLKLNLQSNYKTRKLNQERGKKKRKKLGCF